jgi:hypothetical protein
MRALGARKTAALRRGRRGPWSARASAASLAISAVWHLLLLAVLALAVHPLVPPDEIPPVTVRLLPPLLRPPPPKPPLPVLRRLTEDKPPQPQRDIARPQPVLPKAVEVAQPAQPVLRKLTEAPSPPQLIPPTPAPPAPLETARPEPAPAPPITVQAPAPAAPPALVTVQTPPLVAPAAPAEVQVLTNARVIQAPIEIRPPDRGAASRLDTGPPAVPSITTASGAETSGGGPQAGSGAASGGGAGTRFGGPVAGFGDALRGGLRMRLGCATPDTYKLTAAERAECLRRFGEQAAAAREMGINIPPAKQAEFDRQRACHAATAAGGVPGSASPTTDSAITGLGDSPRLRDCGPGDR